MIKAKKVQAFYRLVAWWIGFISHGVTFATTPHANLVQKNDFLDKSHASIFHIDIVTWVKYTKKVIEKHWALGTEMAIGSVVEWKPLNRVGLQTGLFYSYNSFYTVDFSLDRKNELNPDVFAFWRGCIKTLSAALSRPYQGYTVHVALGNIQFHAISIPLFLRLYLEKSHRWVCYGGPRLICMLPVIKKTEHCPVHIDTSQIKDICYNNAVKYYDLAGEGNLFYFIETIAKSLFSDLLSSILRIHPNNAHSKPINDKQFNWDLVWDFGIEFRGKSGLIVGINGLGIVLGYEFLK